MILGLLLFSASDVSDWSCTVGLKDGNTTPAEAALLDYTRSVSVSKRRPFADVKPSRSTDKLQDVYQFCTTEQLL